MRWTRGARHRRHRRRPLLLRPAPKSPAGSGALPDLERRQQTARNARPRISITLAIFNCLKPIVAAINGAAVGVGITMCLPMDVRMMSTTARIGFVFNKRGMAMEAGSCWFLPRLVGMQRRREWVMTAELFGADEALKGGLVRSVHATDELSAGGAGAGEEIRRQLLLFRRRRRQTAA